MDRLRSLQEELKKAYPYRVELHTHTNPVSRCSQITPAQVVENYHALGAHAVVITNHLTPETVDGTYYNGREDAPDPASEHFRKDGIAFYLKDYHEAKKRGEELGMPVILGIELRFAANFNDYLIYGVDEKDVAVAWDYCNKDLATYYREQKREDNLILQAHPFRDGVVPADPAFLDGVETFNMHPGHNPRVGFCVRFGSEVGGVKVGGTDYHHHGDQGMLLTRFRELPEDSFRLAELLKSGDYVFEIGGEDGSIVLP